MTVTFLKPDNAKNAQIYSPLSNSNINETFYSVVLHESVLHIPKAKENVHVFL